MTSEVVTLSVIEWRRKAREGNLTVEEMKIALEAIRAERLNSGAVSIKSGEKKKAVAAKKVAIDSDDLLAKLSM